MEGQLFLVRGYDVVASYPCLAFFIAQLYYILLGVRFQDLYLIFVIFLYLWQINKPKALTDIVPCAIMLG